MEMEISFNHAGLKDSLTLRSCKIAVKSSQYGIPTNLLKSMSLFACLEREASKGYRLIEFYILYSSVIMFLSLSLEERAGLSGILVYLLLEY